MNIYFQRISEFLSQFHDNFDYCLIGTKSRYHIEYLPDFEKKLEFLTGFDGSNGFCFLPKDLSQSLIFFTDGRYLLQAEKQLSKIRNIKFKIIDLGSEEFKNFSFNEEKKIICDSRIFSDSFFKIFQNKNMNFVGNSFDFESKIEEVSFAINKENVFIYDEEYTGSSYQEKMNLLSEKMTSDIYFFNSPGSICWLLNIRGRDIDCNLIFLCYGIFYKNEKKIKIFCHDESKMGVIKDYENVEILNVKYLDKELLKIVRRWRVGASENITIYYKNLLNEKLVIEKDPCDLLRSKKNEVEILNSKKIHLQDSIALLNFWFWLEENLREKKYVDELMICRKVRECRQEQKNFFDESFDTIAGFNENGAFIHYKVSKESNKILTGKNGLLLLDSGGHYFGGTTDITRVFAIGKISKIMKKHYTLVLKSHLKLTRAIFPYEILMHQLNPIARYDLWQECLDFQHGLGHGVSNFLEVHESPYSINNRNTEKLVENIIISNEPGLYIKNKYGIRIENLMYSKIEKINEETKQKFIGFDNLTFFPYDLTLIEKSLLTTDEIGQINKYHDDTYKKLSKLIVGHEILKFLKEKTRNI